MPQINKPTDYFNTVLYTGDGTSSNAITGVGFQPDFLWIKERNNTRFHQLMDVVRGASVRLQSNSTNAESSSGLNSFDSDGFDVNGSTVNGTNFNTGTYAAWNWLAGGTASSNTDGSITSSVSVNTTSGFSIVSYTGTGANATVGHGLGVAPKMIIVKNRDYSLNWIVGHDGLGSWGNYLQLDNTNASSSYQYFNNTAPTSSVFSIGSGAFAENTNRNSDTYIAYCFAEKKGFSKVFSYTGNGSADGVFNYLGFRPAWIMFKRTDSASQWKLFDTKRTTFNVMGNVLYPNGADAEATGQVSLDFLSNGFKIRETGADLNASGGTYIGLAFAEFPLVSSAGVPTCAR